MDQRAPLIDPELLGRRFRGARIVAGYDRVSDVCDLVRDQYGVAISQRTLYAVERGQQLPSIEQLFALIMAYDPPGGLMYMLPAMRSDAIAWIESRARGGQ